MTSPLPGPLSGVTVVDMTRVLAGPYCTMLLAELGARVLKVERPGVGDDARHFGPFVKGQSAYFMSLNRGKESIALDLRQPDDRAIFEDLLEDADVLVENFRPGALARLGYDWDTLKTRYPRLIYAAISGFGQDGPYASRPAYDLVVQAMGGVMSLTGHPAQPPVRVGTSIGDITAALFAANGIQAALYAREHTGKGQMVDVSMLDCQVALLENAIARTRAQGTAPTPLGARHPSITPFDAFRTQDQTIVIAAGNDDLFRTLCQLLARDDLTQRTEFATNHARTQHADELKDELEQTLCTQPAQTWLQRLQDGGIPCGPIQDVSQVLQDPQVHARNMIVEAHDPQAGPVKMAGNPIKFSDYPDPPQRPPAPQLDADRQTILHKHKP